MATDIKRKYTMSAKALRARRKTARARRGDGSFKWVTVKVKNTNRDWAVKTFGCVNDALEKLRGTSVAQGSN